MSIRSWSVRRASAEGATCAWMYFRIVASPSLKASNQAAAWRPASLAGNSGPFAAGAGAGLASGACLATGAGFALDFALGAGLAAGPDFAVEAADSAAGAGAAPRNRARNRARDRNRMV